MAILSDHVDEDEEPRDVGTLLNNICIPPNFARYEVLEDKDAIAQLDEWKANAFGALEDLRRLLGNKRHETQKSDLIYACAVFQGDGDWTSDDLGALSSGKRLIYATTKMTETLSQKYWNQKERPL